MKKIGLLLVLALAYFTLAAQDRTDSLHIEHYDIHLNITDFGSRNILGYTDLTAVSKVDALNHIDLDLQRLVTDSVKIDGAATRDFSHTGNLLQISLSQPINANDTVHLRVYYSGTPATDSYFGGFYFSGEYCYNLGVAFRDLPHNFGRAWYPCLDFFTDKSTYTFNIETEVGKMAVCGGELFDSISTSDSTVVWRWRLNEPVPTYLTSVAVGNYRHYADTVQGLERIIPIDIYTRPSEFNKIAGSFVHLKDVVHIYEHRFGPYPWNRIGYVGVAFTGGAMEHVTNIAYPQVAINGNTDYESLFIHEFSHMWFGDLITCNRAEEMWINEGFARYNEALADEMLYPSDNPATDGYKTNIRELHHGVLRSAHIDDNGYWPLDAMPQEVTYGTTTYDKGGCVVHTLRQYMGDSLFFSCIQQMLQEFAFQNISTEQLFDFWSQHSGMDLHDFKDAWVSQPGFLHFAIDSIRPTENAGEYQFFVRQRLSHAYRFGHSNKIDITFFSSDNQRYTLEDFTFSGEFGEGVVRLPWQPTTAVVDINEALCDAIIDYGFDLETPCIKNANNANVKLLVNGISEPTYFRVEDNLIAPDPLKVPNNHITAISPDHYWRVVCVPENTLEGGIQFTIKAGNNAAPDYNFLQENSFNDVRLLCRRDCTDDWRPIATEKSGNLTTGRLSTNEIRSGEYAIGLGDGTVGLISNEIKQSNIIVYPNPLRDKLFIKLNHWDKTQNTTCQIFDMNGKLVLKKKVTEETVQINVNNLKSGNYIIEIVSSNEIISSSKFVKQ
ncbi:MAG: T9SS type A sorting domain-containing protein [Bacteroidales bacterium]|nr:T9SS type A sorting domain-containing protein [Bacteroidales bacterium]